MSAATHSDTAGAVDEETGAGTVEFTMPSLGADMDEGTVKEWLVGPGDTVERGDIMAVVETEKSDVDIEIWHGGDVVELLVEPGRTVPVGTPLARLAVEPGQAPAAGDDTQPGSTQANSTQPEVEGPVEVDPTTATEPEPARAESPQVDPVQVDRVRTEPVDGDQPRLVAASPAARRLATDAGLALHALQGSGPGGAIVARDLDRQPQPDRQERRRRAIAQLMSRSKREIPHYYLATTIDVEDMLTRLEAVNGQRPVAERILPSLVLMKAVVDSLAKHPEFNGHWVDESFIPADGVDLGVIVSQRDGGVMAPVIGQADQRSLEELMSELQDLVAKARLGRLRGSDLTEASVSVTNLGQRGVDMVFGVIHPPQVAIIGLGRIVERAWVVDGAVVARRVVTVTLAADHRASDGQRGARLLNTIERNIARQLQDLPETETGGEPDNRTERSRNNDRPSRYGP